MPEIAKLVLIAMAVLLVKHCIADYYLQTAYQFMNKGRYLHPGGLLHAFIHVVFTTPVFLVIAPESLETAALILGAEFLIHYHMDFTKERIGKLTKWTPMQAAFWRLHGTDQLVHWLTYVGIVWALLTPGLWPMVRGLLP